MKKTKLALMIVFLTSGISQAEYRVNIPLDPNISIKDFEVAGDIHLTPTVINRGGSSSIVWNYSFGNEINIEGLGTYNDKSGQVLVSPNVSTEYSIVVKNGSKSKTEKLSLTVIQPTQQINFTADKYRIGYGNSATLSWDVVDASSVSIDNGVGNSLNDSGSSHVSPNTTTLYTLTAKGYEGIADSKKTVNIVVVPDSVINSFTVNNDKITTGENVIFSWQVANAESLSLNPFGPLSSLETGSQSVPFSTSGNFTYTLESVSLSGKKDSQSKTISVFDPAVISSFTVNGAKSVTTSPNTALNFAWGTTSAATVKINNNAVTGNNTVLNAPATAGSTNYILTANNGANQSVSDTVVVTVINVPSIGTITTPAIVNINTAFTMSWTGTDASSYNINGSAAASGLATSPVSNGSATSRSITPTAAGSYTYTVTGINAAGGSTSKTSGVVKVENWVATTATYSDWADSGAVYNCSAWTPDASTVNVGTNFTQTRSCSQNQTRSRQERQTETGTGAIRNNGVAVTENQTVTVGGSQTAAGTKAVAECQYSFGVGYQNYVWAMDRDDYGDYTIVTWNKQQIFYSDSIQYTTINAGGYNYYMGAQMAVGAYQVCRKPL